MNFATGFSKQERKYTGVELRPHFLLTELGLKGSALGAFIGPCDVKTEHLVDWEDRMVNDRITAKKMIHFIGEFFGAPLREGVLAQRLLMSIMGESLRARGVEVERDGDDLFVKKRKLSVSIVTASPVSLLLHTGINLDPEGAPVAAIGLDELGISAESWVPEVLSRWASEWESMAWACTKVRPVM